MLYVDDLRASWSAVTPWIGYAVEVNACGTCVNVCSELASMSGDGAWYCAMGKPRRIRTTGLYQDFWIHDKKYLVIM
jgi:ferredoxin